MLRSDFAPLRPLLATEALERLLVQEECLCPSAAVETSTHPKAPEDFAFPSLAWFPEDNDTTDELEEQNCTGFHPSPMSLCSKESSCSEMSLDLLSWKQHSLKSSGGGNGAGLHRSKRLASELHMLQSHTDEDHRQTKRRNTLTT